MNKYLLPLKVFNEGSGGSKVALRYLNLHHYSLSIGISGGSFGWRFFLKESGFH